MDALNSKIDDNSQAIREELNTTLIEISRRMEEGNDKINTRIDVEIAVVREEIVETNKRCEQHDQDLQRTRDEVDGRLNTMEEVTEARIESLKGRIKTKLKGKVRHAVRNLTVANRERIEELRQQEIVQMREEIEIIRNRPITARVEEHLARIRETRWNNIKSLIDEYFKEIHDNWWTATRHEVHSYDEFKAQFRAKYWSEATQNI
ncbi:hypothetical protein L0F63_007478, partial [Massospora cicadina]